MSVYIHTHFLFQGGSYVLLDFNANVDIMESVEAATSFVFNRAISETDIEALTTSVTTAVTESFTSACMYSKSLVFIYFLESPDRSMICISFSCDPWHRYG